MELPEKVRRAFERMQIPVAQQFLPCPVITATVDRLFPGNGDRASVNADRLAALARGTVNHDRALTLYPRG